MSYFVLWCHEDGLQIKEFTKVKLVEAFEGEDYNFSAINWHKDMGDYYKLLNNCNQGVIIKGEIVTPFEKEVVTKYDIK